MSALLDFLRGDGRDARGRAIAQIWALTNEEIERRHDFIQWLFPLDTASGAVPDSPVLAADEVAILRRDPERDLGHRRRPRDPLDADALELHDVARDPRRVDGGRRGRGGGYDAVAAEGARQVIESVDLGNQD